MTLLKALLLVDPADVEVLFRSAQLEASRGNLGAAIDLLDAIPVEHPEAGIPALGQSADWCLQSQRYDEAESRYRKVLQVVPEAAIAHRQLAYLYNRQGRRHEAAAHVRELCRQGNVRQDELHSLMMLSDAMHDDPNAAATPGEVMYRPIGESGVARKRFADQQYREAAQILRPLVDSGDAPPSIVALYGRAVVEAQDDEQFAWWLTQVDAEVKQCAEYWAAIGAQWTTQQRWDEAIGALLEAVDRDPTDLRSIGRLRSSLQSAGRKEDAQKWADRWDALRELVLENNRVSASSTPDVDAIARVAAMLHGLDRKLEAVMWKSIESIYRNHPPELMAQWNRQRRQLVALGDAFPSQQSRRCGIDKEAFPLPSVDVSSERIVTRATTSASPLERPPVAEFQNIADRVGLDHAFEVAADPQPFGFAIYQSFGGAVAVLDYDLDGLADLYFAQGGANPPEFVGELSNRLYRNLGGRLSQVTDEAGADDRHYCTAVTAGDWNQDGFADIAVANIGRNLMLINQGDGSYKPTVLDDGDQLTRMSASLAIADLTGDGLPDLYEAIYIDDPKIGEFPARNERGEVLQSLLPLNFRPAVDRWIQQNAAGDLDFRWMDDGPDADRTSLGVVVTDLDDRPGNEVFVGNDLRPNQLWSRDAGTGNWSDVAMLRGCAHSFGGANTASMGIAAGDFDNNGAIDLHVTNFQDESVNLFLNDEGVFRDRHVQFGLADVTRSVLGFGSQSIDYTNDGWLDLVVTNGHIEKALAITAEFEQVPQLFANLGGRFELAEVRDPSGYWHAKHLGRGLARLDFDRDGRNDFVITHLGERSALVVNRTPTDNHWVQLRLVGTRSERDAIGAKVQIRFGETESTGWVIAGDGYFSRNEPVVSFGLGTSARVDQLRIRWPSGGEQIITDLPSDHRYVIVEGQAEAFPDD